MSVDMDASPWCAQLHKGAEARRGPKLCGLFAQRNIVAGTIAFLLQNFQAPHLAHFHTKAVTNGRQGGSVSSPCEP